ncbi:hypothetical protein ACQKL5_08195 [Peribacillus sp. NPDC097675]|uniref:hypothetical protein n=1 Tax=Peribacillus sp. NPDC097675 TaxID=3390618 RepID=UPI003D027653
MLTDWEDESGFPFTNGLKNYKSHHFDKNLEEFLKYSSEIKEQFPHIYRVIIHSLMLLDKRDGFEETLPTINIEFFKIIRKQLFGSEIQWSDDLYIIAFREKNIAIL